MCKVCDILQFENFGKQGNVNKVVVVVVLLIAHVKMFSCAYF